MDIISVNEITKGKCLLYMVNKMITDIYIGFCIYIYKTLPPPKGNTQWAFDASHFYYCICIGFLTFASSDRSFTKSARLYVFE